MLITVILSVLLVSGGLGGAAASDLQVFEKSMQRDKTLLTKNDGKHTVREQLHQQMKNKIHRSLDLESFNMHVIPTTSKFSLPTIIKLYPPTIKPLHMRVNMPMRFGRDSEPADNRSPSLKHNLPQRFGRAWEVFQLCAKCPTVREATNPALPQRFGKKIPNWRLFRALANEQLNTGLHWAEDFDLPFSSEEKMEMEEKFFKE